MAGFDSDCLLLFSHICSTVLSSSHTQNPLTALCHLEVMTACSSNCKINSLWSPISLGFGFDKDMRQLLKELRPLEYADSQWKLPRTNEASKIDADDDWAYTAPLFRPNIGDGYEIDDTTGWGRSRKKFSSDNDLDNLFFCNHLLDESEVMMGINDNEANHLRNLDSDAGDAIVEEILTLKEGDPDFLSERRLLREGFCHSDCDFGSFSRERVCNGNHCYTHASDRDSGTPNIENNGLETERTHAPSVKYKYVKTLQASTQAASMATNIVCRPLLPVFSVQQILKRLINRPPSRNLIM